MDNNVIDIKSKKKKRILTSAITDMRFVLTTTSEYIYKIEPVARKYQFGYNIVKSLKPILEHLTVEIRKCEKKLEEINE